MKAMHCVNHPYSIRSNRPYLHLLPSVSTLTIIIIEIIVHLIVQEFADSAVALAVEIRGPPS
jgi:hypothetical protein